MYLVAICEDEIIFSESHSRICRFVLDRLSIEYRLYAFENSGEFWSAFSKGERFDLILLDIIMHGIDGIELAHKIRKHDKDAAIVFVTNHSSYALQGYDVNALDYMLKPLNSDALEKLIALDYKNRFRKKFLMIKCGTENLKIPLRDIICFETVGRRAEITTKDSVFYYQGRLSELTNELPGEIFLRCHVGFVINIVNIRRLTRTEAVAENGKRIPVSRAYSETVKKAFLKQLRKL